MITLIVEDYEQISILEAALNDADLGYELELGNGYMGVPAPCLVVDTVPLDVSRGMKWIKEHKR